jgi:hypothetical protein
MLPSKNLPVKDFAAGVYLSEAQNPIPPFTLYTVHGGGERWGKYRSHSWVENTNMAECTQEISSQ